MPNSVGPYTPAASLAAYRLFTGKTLYDATNPGTPDNQTLDAKWCVHPLQSEVLNLIRIALTGGAAVYVKAAANLPAGPVRVTGYDTANNAFVVNVAGYSSAPAHWILQSALSTGAFGYAYIGGDYVSALDTTLISVGTEVYLDAVGTVSVTAPAGATTFVQSIGRVKTQAVAGVIAALVQPPTKWGSSWIQDLAITSGKLADLAVITTKLNALAVTEAKIADGAVAMLKQELSTRSARNRLINGSFTHWNRLIDPATLTTVADGSYAPDRGAILHNSGAQVRRVDLSGVSTAGTRYGCDMLPNNPGGTDKCGYLQVIQASDCLDLQGRQVTFQVRAKALAGTRQLRLAVLEWYGTADLLGASRDIVLNWDSTSFILGGFFVNDPNFLVSGVSPANTPVSGSYVDLSLTVALSSSFSNVLVFVFNTDDAATQAWQICRAGLYDGDQPRLWRPDRGSEEALACAHRCLRLFNRSGAGSHLGRGIWLTGTSGEIFVQHPARMAYPPTLAAAAANQFQVTNGALTQTLSSLSLNSGDSDEHTSVLAFGTASGTAQTPVALESAVATPGNAWLLLEAEI